MLHKIPTSLSQTLNKNKKLFLKWNTITPLAKNEWYCFLLSAKKEVTKKRRLDRLVQDILSGKKRPCCWAGCSHRD